MDRSGPSSVSFATKVSQRFQVYLDKTVPLVVARWIATLALYVFYFLRVFLLQVGDTLKLFLSTDVVLYSAHGSC